LRGLPPIEWQTGREWFTRQPEGTQLAILGRGRFDLWRRGEATLDDMVSRDWSDTWGGSLRVTSVGDLRSGHGRTWAGGGPVAPTPVAPQAPTAATVRQRIVETTAVQRAEMDAAYNSLDTARSETKSIAAEIDSIRKRHPSGEMPQEVGLKFIRLQNDLYAQRSKITRLENEYRKARQVVAETARPQLRVQNPANAKWKVGKNANLPAAWREGLEGFNELIDSDLIREESVGIKAKAGRAYYSHDKVVRVSKTGDVRRTVVHELGHWLEHTNPEMHDKILEFYDRRTEGEKLQWLGKGYRRDEKTRRDRFIDPYMGKEYMRQGVRDATEILSMGIEYMYADPVTLAVKDPDYFDFIFNLVRGING